MDGTEYELDEQTFRLTVITLLAEIRDVLTHGVQAATADEPIGCQHPEEQRVSLATPADPDHWVCAVPTCRYEHHGLVHN